MDYNTIFQDLPETIDRKCLSELASRYKGCCTAHTPKQPKKFVVSFANWHEEKIKKLVSDSIRAIDDFSQKKELRPDFFSVPMQGPVTAALRIIGTPYVELHFQALGENVEDPLLSMSAVGFNDDTGIQGSIGIIDSTASEIKRFLGSRDFVVFLIICLLSIGDR